MQLLYILKLVEWVNRNPTFLSFPLFKDLSTSRGFFCWQLATVIGKLSRVSSHTASGRSTLSTVCRVRNVPLKVVRVTITASKEHELICLYRLPAGGRSSLLLCDMVFSVLKKKTLLLQGSFKCACTLHFAGKSLLAKSQNVDQI